MRVRPRAVMLLLLLLLLLQRTAKVPTRRLAARKRKATKTSRMRTRKMKKMASGFLTLRRMNRATRCIIPRCLVWMTRPLTWKTKTRKTRKMRTTCTRTFWSQRSASSALHCASVQTDTSTRSGTQRHQPTSLLLYVLCLRKRSFVAVLVAC